MSVAAVGHRHARCSGGRDTPNVYNMYSDAIRFSNCSARSDELYKEVDPMKKLNQTTLAHTGRDAVAPFAGPTSGAVHLK